MAKITVEGRETFEAPAESCQILCDGDMTVRVLMTLSSSGLPDPGGQPEPHITPDPVWTTNQPHLVVRAGEYPRTMAHVK